MGGRGSEQEGWGPREGSEVGSVRALERVGAGGSKG